MRDGRREPADCCAGVTLDLSGRRHTGLMIVTLDSKTAIVTGAGRGIGRANALGLAAAGAAVIVVDAGVAADGLGRDPGPAEDVVAEIRAAGGRAVADMTDISDWRAAKGLVEAAVAHFGRLDIVVNNAAISRFSGGLGRMSMEDWDHTIAVNLRGTAAVTHWAAEHWRRFDRDDGRAIVNTTSTVGLSISPSAEMPNPAYAASKAGVAALTRASAIELASLGVRVNAVAPVARTRISEVVAPSLMKPVSEGFDRMGPENVAAVVLYLASPRCRLTGRVLGIKGAELTVMREWTVVESFDNGDQTWSPDALDAVLRHADW